MTIKEHQRDNYIRRIERLVEGLVRASCRADAKRSDKERLIIEAKSQVRRILNTIRYQFADDNVTTLFDDTVEKLNTDIADIRTLKEV